MNKISRLLLAAFLMAISSVGLAQQAGDSNANSNAGGASGSNSGSMPPPPHHGPGGRHQPPPEAFTTCNGKSSGETAGFTSPRGDKINGTCETDPSGKLLLVPDFMKQLPKQNQ